MYHVQVPERQHQHNQEGQCVLCTNYTGNNDTSEILAQRQECLQSC